MENPGFMVLYYKTLLNPWATFKVFISSIDWPLRSLDRDEKRCNERSRLFLLYSSLFSWKFNDFHTYRRKIGWPPSSIYVEWLVEKFWLCYILLLSLFSLLWSWKSDSSITYFNSYTLFKCLAHEVSIFTVFENH